MASFVSADVPNDDVYGSYQVDQRGQARVASDSHLDVIDGDTVMTEIFPAWILGIEGSDVVRVVLDQRPSGAYDLRGHPGLSLEYIPLSTPAFALIHELESLNAVRRGRGQLMHGLVYYSMLSATGVSMYRVVEQTIDLAPASFVVEADDLMTNPNRFRWLSFSQKCELIRTISEWILLSDVWNHPPDADGMYAVDDFRLTSFVILRDRTSRVVAHVNGHRSRFLLVRSKEMALLGLMIEIFHMSSWTRSLPVSWVLAHPEAITRAFFIESVSPDPIEVRVVGSVRPYSAVFRPLREVLCGEFAHLDDRELQSSIRDYPGEISRIASEPEYHLGTLRSLADYIQNGDSFLLK